MEYRVEEIARRAGISVDTVRFYQARGLLAPPERRGRVAIYSEDHLSRLRRIRALNREGLTLEGVRKLLEQPAEWAGAGGSLRESLLGALDEAEGERTYGREELAAASGLPEELLQVLEGAALLEPSVGQGPPRYTESDLLTAESARLFLDSDFPLEELLPLAQRHARSVAEIADEAVELFDRHVRRSGEGREAPSREAVTRVFRELLPAATTLVALHFQRTLIQRARARLARSGDDEALEAAIEATETARLKLVWG
ncbi:MAG: MerR family transcriptional regulator [Myxococcota bacterium]